MCLMTSFCLCFYLHSFSTLPSTSNFTFSSSACQTNVQIMPRTICHYVLAPFSFVSAFVDFFMGSVHMSCASMLAIFLCGIDTLIIYWVDLCRIHPQGAPIVVTLGRTRRPAVYNPHSDIFPAFFPHKSNLHWPGPSGARRSRRSSRVRLGMEVVSDHRHHPQRHGPRCRHSRVARLGGARETGNHDRGRVSVERWHCYGTQGGSYTRVVR